MEGFKVIEKIFIVLHSHTDIGFTHDQPVVWDLHGRFIEEAIEEAEKDMDKDGHAVFRWTIESAAMVYNWLKTAPQQLVERFMILEKVGRIEVTCMYADIAPLYDVDQLVESFQVVRKLRKDYGLNISSAMNADVNGQNWTLINILKDLGIDGLSMAINTHFGRAPKPRPSIFWWESKSGNRIMAYNGFTYGSARGFGIGDADMEIFEKKYWPRLEKLLEENAYPIPVLMIQGVGAFGDNGTIVKDVHSYVEEWNKQGKKPELIVATPRMWWEEVKKYGDRLPVCRGDWTDFWNFGSISAAKELSVYSRNHVRLRNADALSAIVLNMHDKPKYTRTAKSFGLYRDQAWECHHNYCEHTWGADCGIDCFEAEDTAAMWHHKAYYTYNTRSLALLMQRDALAEFSHFVQRTDENDVLVFNPLPWARTISGVMPAGVDKPRGSKTDQTAGRHFQERKLDLDLLRGAHINSMWGDQYPHSVMLPTKIEGFGYTVLPRTSFVDVRDHLIVSDNATIENEYYRLNFDKTKGGITSWFDKRLQHEWVEQSARFEFNTYVHERLADTTSDSPRTLLYNMNWRSGNIFSPDSWQPDWSAERTTPYEVISHKVYNIPTGIRVIQELKTLGCDGVLVQSVFLPNYDEFIEFETSWNMGADTHPQANYIYYPFNLKNAVVHYDIGGQAVMPGQDQLEGVCYDYFTGQRWVDLSNNEIGMTIAIPENPLFMLGDFNFAKAQTEFKLKHSTFLGWVTNNYWETNFRAHQPGSVKAKYRLLPHKGGFNEVAAHRFGLEAAFSQPLMQHMGEKCTIEPKLPQKGALLNLSSDENESIIAMHIKPDASGKKMIIRLLNITDITQQAIVGSNLFKIVSAELCDILDDEISPLNVQDGILKIDVDARRLLTISVAVTNEANKRLQNKD